MRSLRLIAGIAAIAGTTWLTGCNPPGVTASVVAEGGTKANAGQERGVATLAQLRSISDESAANFAKRGYSAYHSCQDASNVFVRICNRDKIQCRRFGFDCGSLGGHAIVQVLVQTPNGPRWCPQEPQSRGVVGATSNFDESLCGLDPDFYAFQDDIARLCEKAFDAAPSDEDAPFLNSSWNGAGENPAGSLSSPLNACAASGRYSDRASCVRCCDAAWGGDRDVARSVEWVNTCKWHCEGRFRPYD